MLKYKQIWHGIKPIRWLIKFNLTHIIKIKCQVIVLLATLVTLLMTVNKRTYIAHFENLRVQLRT